MKEEVLQESSEEDQASIISYFIQTAKVCVIVNSIEGSSVLECAIGCTHHEPCLHSRLASDSSHP